MRRNACFLAILGLSVQVALGDEPFGPEAATSRTVGRNLQFYSGRQLEPAKQPVPTKFTREAARGESGSELRNYYQELFGSAEQAEAAPEQQRTQLKPAAAIKETEKTDNDVVHAEFQASNGETSASEIQPVKWDNPFARPFPGRSASPRTAAVQAKTLSRSSLTEPISVSTPSSAPQETARMAPTPPQQPKADAPQGSVTITRAHKPAATHRGAVHSETFVNQNESGPQTPSVSIEWVKRSGINVGQECHCDLVVKNTSKSPAQRLEIQAHFPETVRLVNAKPLPSHTDTYLGWEIPTLAPGEERTIQITMIPLQRGTIDTRADVRFTGTAVSSFNVSEPLLAIDVDGPSEVLVGDPASQMVTVSNPGTGIASNVRVEAIIPPGLEHARGERLVMELGSLNPGESRTVRLALAAVQGGRHQLQVRAQADSDLVRSTSSEVRVIAPKLTASIDGPQLRYLGRQGTFTLSVVNDGAAPTDNVRVMHKIPEGFEFKGADQGARFDRATNLLNWFVGRLEPGQKAELKVTLNSTKLGEFKHVIRATSEHGSLSGDELVTTVEGTSALAVEIVDLDDPVEVGSEAIYEVRVKNEGSAPARDVGLKCELAPGMTYLAAKGASDHVVEAGAIVFRTLPEIGPGQTSVFRIHVASQTAGSLRFRTRLSSESINQPLTTEELTKFYAE